MSQATYVIPDSDGNTFETNLNAALAAMATQNAGTTDPSYKVAGMYWWRTDVPGTGTHTLYHYDGTNTVAIATRNTSTGVFTWLVAAGLGVTNTWTKGQINSPVALTDGATITPDFATGNVFTLTIGGNRTLANPNNLVAGQSGQIVITQDGTGSRTLAYGSKWKFPGGSAPVLSTAAGAVDILSWVAVSSSVIAAQLSKNFS